jgi:hypothetical protein
VLISRAEPAVLSRLFSSAVFGELARFGSSPLFSRLLGDIHRGAVNSSALVRDVFDLAFSALRRAGYRDEYVYRAAITEKVLLGVHSLRTASMLTEFRVADRKADLIILNGTATVYEIKSERDTLARLSHQLEAYSRVFPRLVVITAEQHVAQILEHTDERVGVFSLSDRYQISTIREPVTDYSQICPLTVSQSLRTSECCAILRKLGRPLPDVPNTRLRAALDSEFKGLAPIQVHQLMVGTLKLTRNLQPLTSLLDQLPSSLHPAALSIRTRKGDHERLVRAVHTPLEQALEWAA